MPSIPLHRFIRRVAELSAVAALLSGAFVMAGCSNKSGAKMAKYRQNPNPTQLYDLTVKIDKAPGPLVLMTSAIHYEVANVDCLPPAEFFSGAQTMPTSAPVKIGLRKIDDSTYQGRFALDGLIDDAYYGRSVCRFKPSSVSVSFRATGAAKETEFVAGLFVDRTPIVPEKSFYYWRGVYPRHETIEDYPDFGSDSREEFKGALRNDLFSITIVTNRVAQP